MVLLGKEAYYGPYREHGKTDADHADLGAVQAGRTQEPHRHARGKYHADEMAELTADVEASLELSHYHRPHLAFDLM